MANNILTQELVKELFDYCDGQLFWRVFTNPRAPIGSKVGCVHASGYLRTKINNKIYFNHRIIFLYHHGYLPKCIDHIDGNPSNNKIENLREASRTQNNQNAKTRKDNTSGVKGVRWDKDAKKWRVRVWVNGKRKSLGYYDSLEQAELVATKARNKHHGEFARHQ